MANDTTVRAPYNFVPFSDKILEYEGTPPAHNDTDPALKTGEIHVTLTAWTPVLISDGETPANFFRGPDGTLQIPGSTIRGMVRQNMQILGFGLVRPGQDIEDKRLFYRKVSCPEDSVFSNLKNHYHAVYHSALRDEASRRGQDPDTAPLNVPAGYLRRAGNGKYQIQPVKGPVLRVSRQHPDVQAFGDAPSRAFSVSYSENDGQVLQIQLGNVSGMEHGVLLYTGNPPEGQPPNPLYLFPEADEALEPVPLEKDALTHANDQELAENFRRGGGNDPDFWKLPRDGESKPVFYIRREGHTCFGISRFLRLRYQNSVADGLPKAHRDKADGASKFLDWPRAILGWTEGQEACRSRVSFGNFYLQGKEETPEEAVITPGGPKPTYFPSYLKDGRHYDEDGFLLRGYKQYWLQNEVQPVDAGTYNKKLCKKLYPLPENTKFSGVIRYKNLRPEELGLLLWSIRLEEDSFQSVGMGKPYGYGRMMVSIDELREVDLAKMYCPENLCAAPAAAAPNAVQAYIDSYDAAAAKALQLKDPEKKKPSITGTEEIQDFFYLKRAIRPWDKVKYMTRLEHEEAEHPLRSAADFRKEEKEKEYDDEAALEALNRWARAHNRR